MNTENSKTNNTDKFRLILADKRNLKEKKKIYIPPEKRQQIIVDLRFF